MPSATWVQRTSRLSQSTVNLAITSIPDITSQTTVEVDGTVDAGYTVYVNGVMGTPNGDGSWSAYNVPVNGTGTSVSRRWRSSIPKPTASPAGEAGLIPPCRIPATRRRQPWRRWRSRKETKTAIICTKYFLDTDVLWADDDGLTNDIYENESWQLASAGNDTSTSWGNYFEGGNAWMGYLITWVGFQASYQFWDEYGMGKTTTYTNSQEGNFSTPSATYSSTEDMTGTTFGHEESIFGSTQLGYTTSYVLNKWDFNATPGVLTTHRNVASAYVLRTGGKAASQRQAMFQLNVTAQNMAPSAPSDPGRPRDVRQNHGHEQAVGE